MEGVPILVSEPRVVCQPMVFYPGEKESFENRDTAFQQTGRTSH